MDRKEAIKILKNICLEDWSHYPEHNEAFKEAIKALEALDKIQEITEEVLEKTLSAPVPPYYTPSVTVEEKPSMPNCCKNCSNHPSNGGSGICHCTLLYFEYPMKWSIQGDMTIGDWAELAGNTKYVNMLEVLGEENHED